MATVEVGDYIYVSLEGYDDHGFLVVGWGPVLDTLEALNYDELSQTRSETDTIPYVADFCFGTDGTGRIVMIYDGDVVSLEDNPVGIARLVWSPDSSQVATIEGSVEGRYRIRIWDADTGQQVREFDAHGVIPDLRAAWTDEGLRWITEDEEKTVRVWEEGGDEPLFTLRPDYYLRAVWLSPSGSYLASSNLDHGLVQIWNIQEGQLVQTLDASIIEIIWTSDETCVATASFNNPHLKNSTKVQLWDMATGDLLQTIDAQMEGVGNIAWSPDGTAFAYIDGDGAIHVWGME